MCSGLSLPLQCLPCSSFLWAPLVAGAPFCLAELGQTQGHHSMVLKGNKHRNCKRPKKKEGRGLIQYGCSVLPQPASLARSQGTLCPGTSIISSQAWCLRSSSGSQSASTGRMPTSGPRRLPTGHLEGLSGPDQEKAPVSQSCIMGAEIRSREE